MSRRAQADSITLSTKAAARTSISPASGGRGSCCRVGDTSAANPGGNEKAGLLASSELYSREPVVRYQRFFGAAFRRRIVLASEKPCRLARLSVSIASGALNDARNGDPLKELHKDWALIRPEVNTGVNHMNKWNVPMRRVHH